MITTIAKVDKPNIINKYIISFIRNIHQNKDIKKSSKGFQPSKQLSNRLLARSGSEFNKRLVFRKTWKYYYSTTKTIYL